MINGKTEKSASGSVCGLPAATWLNFLPDLQSTPDCFPDQVGHLQRQESMLMNKEKKKGNMSVILQDHAVYKQLIKG